jgi:hypothetical protein
MHIALYISYIVMGEVMIVFKIEKNAIRLAVCSILFIIGIVLLGSILESQNKISVKTFLSSSRLIEEGREIEIFDISAGKVIAKYHPTSIIREEAVSFIGKITGMYVKVKALPDNGHIIRIPFDSAININSKWVTDCGITSVDELYILFPNFGQPYLLILDEKDRPWFFNFNADTSTLLHYLNNKENTIPS